MLYTSPAAVSVGSGGGAGWASAAAVARPSELLGELFGADFVKPGVARLVRENVVFGAPAT